MTTEAEVKGKLDWNTFIELEADRNMLSGTAKEKAMVGLLDHVDGYRKFDWKDIKRHLAEDFNLVCRVEPHWTSPGSAVYWQEQRVRERVKTDAGLETRWVSKGWETVGPLPANNSSQIAHYLEKGFRLRPPSFGVDVEPSQPAAPSEESQGVPKPFKCERHGEEIHRFVSWKTYIRHCENKRELPEYGLPKEVADAISTNPYRCFLHGLGFRSRRTAIQHLKGRGVLHLLGGLTVEKMEAKATAQLGTTELKQRTKTKKN